MRKLTKKNLSNLTPHPLYSRFHYSHPTVPERERALQEPLARSNQDRLAHLVYKTISVLPFENLSRDPDNACFVRTRGKIVASRAEE